MVKLNMTSEQIISLAKKALYEVEISGKKQNLRGGSTATAVFVINRQNGVDVLCVSVGDSPAYLVGIEN